MKEEIKTNKMTGKYFEAVGRRKTAVARARIFINSSGIIVNDRPVEKYFSLKKLQKVLNEPFKVSGFDKKTGLSLKVSGSGPVAQAEACRHAISRALIKIDPELRKSLKGADFLKRDPRMVERKKPGLRKARRAHQWKKR